MSVILKQFMCPHFYPFTNKTIRKICQYIVECTHPMAFKETNVSERFEISSVQIAVDFSNETFLNADVSKPNSLGVQDIVTN